MHKVNVYYQNVFLITHFVASLHTSEGTGAWPECRDQSHISIIVGNNIYKHRGRPQGSELSTGFLEDQPAWKLQFVLQSSVTVLLSVLMLMPPPSLVLKLKCQLVRFDWQTLHCLLLIRIKNMYSLPTIPFYKVHFKLDFN